MITGDDISRIPETTKPDFECNKEEEKPSYAAVARSRPTSECNPDEPVVEDVEDPVVEDVTPGKNCFHGKSDSFDIRKNLLVFTLKLC